MSVLTCASRLPVYRQRRPYEQDLYQALNENLTYYLDPIQFHGNYEHLSKRQEKTFRRFLECGIVAYGFARAHCEGCGKDLIIAFSCRMRGVCPSCAAKRYELFSRFVRKEVILPVAHRQLVFTLPKILRPFFQSARRRTRLYQMAHEVVRARIRNRLGLGTGVRVGMIAILQTFGDSLNFHPHIHALVACGLWEEDVFRPYVFCSDDYRSMAKLFRAKVLRTLTKDEAITPDLAERILRWRHTSGFQVNGDVYIPQDDPEGLVRILRYIARPPISFRRVTYDRKTGQVTIYKHKRVNGKPAIAITLHALELIARLAKHIPPKGTHSQRYYGVYSTRYRTLQKKTTGPVGSTPSDQDQSCSSKTKNRGWAMLLKQVFEVDPLTCPTCGNSMRLVSFINREQHQAIEKIILALGLDIPDLEELARAPPLWVRIKEAIDHQVQLPEEYFNQDADDFYFIDLP